MANSPEPGWVKAALPRGLYGRAALILFLPVVVVSIVVAIVFLQRHFEGVTRQMTSSMVRELGFVARSIEDAGTPVLARRAGTDLAGPLGLELEMPAPALSRDMRDLFDLSGRVVIKVLHDRLPQVTGVDLGSNDRRVTVGMDGPHGRYRLSFERRRVSASNPHQLLVLLIGTSLLITGIASIFLRNQLRPIRRLARAAEAYGRGQVVTYRPAGASELRSAGAAFLDMRNRLERHNEQRKMMISGIGHDLRTPLTRLRLGLSMLSPDMPPDSAEIAAMEADLAEMNRMVDAFLDYARNDAQDSPPQPVQAAAFLRSLVADAQRAGQNVRLICPGDAENAVATFRPDMLRRALENLIGNAARYGSQVEVELGLGPRSLRISVEDDGPGIPEDSIDQALRPFTQLDASRNRNSGQGAGLGLAIAADVVRGHGGYLRLGRGDSLGGLRAEIVLPR